MFNPGSTYRIQFHKDFNFDKFEAIIPYLAALGIKTIYASPIFKAVPGSMHGYDVTDPLVFNPEIGTLSQLRSINKKLKELKISWLQDIVPNHMAYHPDNAWLMDVLEKGRRSVYIGFFDMQWGGPVNGGRVMTPFLGKTWEQAVADGEIDIQWNGRKLVFDYFGQQYPLNIDAYRSILWDSQTSEDSLIRDIDQLLLIDSAVEFSAGFDDFLNREKAALTQAFSPDLLNKFNVNTDQLNAIANGQFYQLCHWGDTNKWINYRRFFTVNGLICLNMQDEAVFDAYHRFIKQLLDEDLIQGLRVDHIDGLYDPKTYLERLRRLTGPDAYIIVEKILQTGEQLPVDWPVQGNTGYDTLATLNNLFTLSASRNKFSAYYKQLDDNSATIQEKVLLKKRLILEQSMQGELDNLYRLLLETDSSVTDHGLKAAIGEFLVRCPVYRYYGNSLPLSEPEGQAVEQILNSILKHRPGLTEGAGILKKIIYSNTEAGDTQSRRLHFYMRLMQFAGPLMAKGVEDTLMYTYSRFIDHNEVGDSPLATGIKVDDFHRAMIQRNEQWPLSVTASSTHDTKRGEDVRARLNVLSDLAGGWLEKVTEWQTLNYAGKSEISPNDKYFIYQTIIGAHPMPGKPLDDFPRRLKEYIIKALREGKENSGWAQPDEVYEDKAVQFALALLKRDSRFSKTFRPFFKQVADYGIINSLAQVLLKFTIPGVPDLYQGCELWDLSLVDPDNRRAVDYTVRQGFLNDDKADWTALWRSRYDGDIKLKLTARLLAIRNQYAVLLSEGAYIQLEIKGALKDNALAFARHHQAEWLVVIVPLHLAAINAGGTFQKTDWRNTRVVTPKGAPLSWTDLLTGNKGYNGNELPLNEILNDLPLALLKLSPAGGNRGAGILMHITSLPGPFPIGDIGPSAYRFADLLFSARQKYWQMLPVNPTTMAAVYSPYSAESAMAGNTLLISPEILMEQGLLDEKDIRSSAGKNDRAGFAATELLKKNLFGKAYNGFITNGSESMRKEFDDFKKSQHNWLNDYALYRVLKDELSSKAWHTWPAEYKLRDEKALKKASEKHSAAIDQVKWLQFTFTKQWASLRSHCADKQISLLGDMPFYISHDSADVWANPDIFSLDKNGKMAGIAGVPPDYFSAGGQLWGMPVYRWDMLKKQGFGWWIQRIKKNLEYFDLIRLDHFRAFSAYWEAPGGSKNAIGGKWMPGPGAVFFDAVKRSLGSLPFVAEDLGEISEDVYQLRDQFGLPGMRVLQFAFDPSMPVSPHIPHNYTMNSFAYTGTHDNNTTRGWFREDVKSKDRKKMEQYIGKKLYGRDVHCDMIRLCHASVAKAAIIPMQDVLGLDGSARMNVPASTGGNWSWRMAGNAFGEAEISFLQHLVIEYNR